MEFYNGSKWTESYRIGLFGEYCDERTKHTQTTTTKQIKHKQTTMNDVAKEEMIEIVIHSQDKVQFEEDY